MTSFPNFPAPGKNSKIYISTSDGQALILAEMELQSSTIYRGKTYTDTIYKLGTGKTLINMRPEKQPEINIDGIIDGLEISPGAAADDVAVSAGIIEVNGEQITVTADATVALTTATAASTLQWNAILSALSDGSISVAAGTPTSAGGTLLDTYGVAAGQRPLIAVDQLLVGWRSTGTAGTTVVAGDIDYLNREDGGVDYQILPNIGGCKLSTALAKIHTGTVGRKVFFSGNYYDNVMSEIATAKDWAMNANSTDISDETYNGVYGSSFVNGFGVTFSQLASDKKVTNAVFLREGHCAIKVAYANGFAWQSAATVVPNFTNPAAAMAAISVTATLLDFPEEA